MPGLVRADNLDDEQAAFEWATEIRFEGSVQVDADSVSLSLEDVGGFWEQTKRRTWDLGADLTRCFEELEELRARSTPVEAPVRIEEPPPAQPAVYDHRDAASA